MNDSNSSENRKDAEIPHDTLRRMTTSSSDSDPSPQQIHHHVVTTTTTSKGPHHDRKGDEDDFDDIESIETFLSSDFDHQPLDNEHFATFTDDPTASISFMSTYSSTTQHELPRRYRRTTRRGRQIREKPSDSSSGYGTPSSNSSIKKNSPIPEVAATIPVTDDPSLPVLTFRYWFLSTFLTIFGAASAQFFWFRLNSLSINSFVLIVASYPLGLGMARILPEKWLGMTLNPGPFNIKEHAAIIITASTSIYPAYATDLLGTHRLFFARDDPSKVLSMSTSLVLLFSSQLIGYGLAGLLRKVLVYPARMWWPYNVVLSSMFHTLHGSSHTYLTEHRLRMFTFVLVCAILYQFLPSYLAPALQMISVACLFGGGPTGRLGTSSLASSSLADPRPFLSQLSSGFGGGLSVLTFDWTVISPLTPMFTPLWAQMNVLFANALFSWIVTPLLFTSNFWDAQKFPVFGVGTYTVNGSAYNLSAILTSNWTVDPQKYEAYSPIRLSPHWGFVYGCAFATMTASLVHILLYHYNDIAVDFKGVPEEEKDIHSKMMEIYPDVPLSWFLTLLALMTAFMMYVFTVTEDQLQLPWWSILVAVTMALLFGVPAGIIQAVTNYRLRINVFSEFIIGLCLPGRPIANMTFKTYAFTCLDQSLAFVSDLKLGHYLKIPPRSLLVCQIYGTIIGCCVNYVVLEVIMNTVPDVWASAKGLPVHDIQWDARNAKVFYTAAVLWGAISPARFFGPETPYSPLMLFFLAGAVLPILFYILNRFFPKVGFHLINWPLIFHSTSLVGSGSANALISTGIVSFVSQYYLRHYHARFYDKYNYIISTALDTASVLTPVLVFVIFFLAKWMPQPFPPYYPLNPNPDVYDRDYCYNRTAV